VPPRVGCCGNKDDNGGVISPAEDFDGACDAVDDRFRIARDGGAINVCDRHDVAHAVGTGEDYRREIRTGGDSLDMDWASIGHSEVGRDGATFRMGTDLRVG
jgi:hypothetical protein